MLLHLCGILIFIVCGKSLSKENVPAASTTCVVSNKFIEMREDQVPKVETEASSNQDVKLTAAFKVDLTGDSITGNITFTFDGGRDLKNFIIKLTQPLNERTRDKEKYYFPLDTEEKYEMNKSGWHADLNCIQIPLIPSAVLTTEVFQINMTSCSCDITEMAENVTNTCIHFCHMNPVSTHCFPAAREACCFFREHLQDDVYMTLKANKIYTNFTRFRGYFTNINPYATVHVSVFPDDYRHEPHLPLWTSLVKVTAESEIYFSVVAYSHGYTSFYAKMTVSCNKDEIGDEFISETAMLVTKEITNVEIGGDHDDSTDSQDDDDDDDDDGDDDDDDDDDDYSVKREVVYGTVVGLLSVCSVITAFVWLKILQRRRSKNNQRYCQTGGTEPPDKVMLVFHPDSDRHSDTVEKLMLFLEKFNICVNDKPEHPFWNWRDFAERVGEEYEDVIIVLSSGLIELCKLYRKKGTNSSVHNKRWNELFEQRHGEYIPCVVFDKLRTLVQDKCSNGKTYFVTFVDNSEDCDAVCACNGSDTVCACNGSGAVCAYQKSDTVCAHQKSDTVCAHQISDTVSLHQCCDTATICYQNVSAHYSSGKESVNGSNDKVCLNNNSDTDCVINIKDKVCVYENSDSVYLSNNRDTVCVNASSDTVSKEELSDTVHKLMFHKDVDPNYCECNTLQDSELFKCMCDSKKKSNICSDTKNMKDFCEFFRLYTFWNPKNTYFHSISTQVLKRLLLSERDSHFETNSVRTLSLLHILKNLE